MKKKNVVIFILTLILIIMIFIVLGKNSKNKNYTLERIENVEYLLYSENDRYGIIDKNGNVLIKAEYDEIDIPNPSKPVFICKYGYDADKMEYKIKVLNEKNEQILYQYYMIDAIKLDWDISEIPFEKSVLKYKQKGKFGIIDFSGNVVTKAKYDEIESLSFQEGLLLVKKKGKYGVINIKGDYILKEKYDIIKANENYQASEHISNVGFVVGQLTSNGYKYGYVNYKNQKILNIEYDQIEIINKLGEESTYFIAFKEGLAGFYNNKYNILKNMYNDIVYNEYNNCLIIEKDGKQGLFKVNGEMVLPIEYDSIFISGRYINTRKDKDITIYDFNTMDKVNIENVIALNETIDNSKYIIAISSNDKYKIFDVVEQKIKDEEYDYLEYIGEDKFIAYKNEKFGIINSRNEIVVNFEYTDLQRIQNEQILRGIIKDAKYIKIKYLNYSGETVEYNNENSLYPENVGQYKKIDLGYGQPYYTKAVN